MPVPRWLIDFKGTLTFQQLDSYCSLYKDNTQFSSVVPSYCTVISKGKGGSGRSWLGIERVEWNFLGVNNRVVPSSPDSHAARGPYLSPQPPGRSGPLQSRDNKSKSSQCCCLVLTSWPVDAQHIPAAKCGSLASVSPLVARVELGLNKVKGKTFFFFSTQTTSNCFERR